MSTYQSDLLRLLEERGYIHQVTDAAALDGLAGKEIVPGYIGFDATAPSLHVGSLVQIMLLRRLQQSGHKPVVVMGQGEWIAGNAGQGFLEALLGAAPMLILTEMSDNGPLSHHAPYQGGTGDYGGWDAIRALQGVTKRVITSHHPAQAVQQVQLALKHALTGQPGPVVTGAGRVGERAAQTALPVEHGCHGEQVVAESEQVGVAGTDQRPERLAGGRERPAARPLQV